LITVIRISNCLALEGSCHVNEMNEHVLTQHILDRLGKTGLPEDRITTKNCKMRKYRETA